MLKKPAVGELFSGAIIALAVGIVLSGLIGLASVDSMRTANWALLALITTGLRIRTRKDQEYGLSLNFIFVLLSIVQMTFEETVLLAGATAAVQVAIHLHRSIKAERPASVMLQIASPIVAAAIGYAVFHSPQMIVLNLNLFLRLLITATILFAGNTFPLAVMQMIVRKTPLPRAWREFSIWSFPVYLSGAAVAGLVHAGTNWLGGINSATVLLPLAFICYFASHFYMGRMSRQKAMLESMAGLQERTIEALALAIESKDQSAQEHLKRLRLYDR